MAEEIRKEIDNDIVYDLIKSQGWFEVKIPDKVDYWYTPELDYRPIEIEIGEWVDANIKGKYSGRRLKWLFEDEQDAVLFALRWL